MGAKLILNDAFPAEACMSEPHMRHLKNAIARNFSSFSPEALAGMFDDLGDRGFISCAQAADLLAVIQSQDDVVHELHSNYWHVICHRILDRWNTTIDAHGLGACYHGWSGHPDTIIKAARTHLGPRSNSEIRAFVQNELFVRGALRFPDDSHSHSLPGFYANLRRRLGDDVDVELL